MRSYKQSVQILKPSRRRKGFCVVRSDAAAISILANIAEGHGRRTVAEFANLLNIARGSAVELQSHLYIASDLGYITDNEFFEIYALLDEISKMNVSLAQYLRRYALGQPAKLEQLSQLLPT